MTISLMITRFMNDTYKTLLCESNLLFVIAKVDLEFFEHCIINNHHRQDFGVIIHSFEYLFEYVHSDV